MLVRWHVDGATSEVFQEHVARIPDYLWLVTTRESHVFPTIVMMLTIKNTLIDVFFLFVSRLGLDGMKMQVRFDKMYKICVYYHFTIAPPCRDQIVVVMFCSVLFHREPMDLSSGTRPLLHKLFLRY